MKKSVRAGLALSFAQYGFMFADGTRITPQLAKYAQAIVRPACVAGRSEMIILHGHTVTHKIIDQHRKVVKHKTVSVADLVGSPL